MSTVRVRDPEQTALSQDSDQDELATERRKARRKRLSKNWTFFLLFAGPNILLILAFIYYPLISNMYYSTLDWRLGSSTATQIGLDNYVRFFTSDDGLEVWRVTAIFTLGTVAGSMILGLLIALVLNKKIPGRTVARTAVFSPYVLSGVGVALVWNFIFNPERGALSHILDWFGLDSPQWYLDEDWALLMVIIVYVWKNLGFCAVVFLAGLQSIPQDLIEAATIDRAGPIRRFFSVTLPLLTPTVFFLLVTNIIFSMTNAFDILRTMTPTGHGTNTIIFEVYLQSFGAYQRAGYSAAIAVVLFFTLFLITVIQMRFVERKVHYQ
ncbi:MULTISPECIES: carbohydrate ABC transporter permease [Auritidibacter]|uniref:carbohydrate ABC transporter permease n=1 Tax=Auritidibacter TaxID=1160973 RepID=UPI000D735D27|nr:MULTISPECIES: sugar ABC transporter permease [Auritidibacter]PXA75123.1 glycerol-3-phosphate ABC transporter permease [Auritidibacter sp. NML120779]AXR73113.1 sugar ABC transporter permease [Auritidibacter sp. NML130574]NIH71555.1 sn-glycerol 3-phosphate transport system permease protein [Auritidibacter ignavus]PXA77388.1 glycerol-3-phosphate ABC transporter permease [Auritidibacter sp. NML100628]PXA81867.1 glycerol-3-phosphate ABC transporter permease [Auritidibacter sp. NML120636]